jgi:hypothetical protein
MSKTTARPKRELAIYADAVNIKPPLLPGGLVPESPVRVTISSPLRLRRAVYEIAWYFKSEFHYDFTQYGRGGRDDDPKHVAFLWPHPEVCQSGFKLLGCDDFLLPMMGACCFRWWEWKDAPAGWVLQWIWMHPFCRGRGMLSKTWPKFREEFGDFFTDPPLSDAMEAFLTRRKECYRCGRHCICTPRYSGRRPSSPSGKDGDA